MFWSLSGRSDSAPGLDAVRANVGRLRLAVDDDLLALEVRAEDAVRHSVRMTVALAGLRTFTATGDGALEGHIVNDDSNSAIISAR